ncbi:MAG: hypothetical protein OEV73_05125 [Desulfobulbaceae bacterium]|nr:hypothetical protein [Desulfobulbaceae bacterium]
MIDSYVQHRIYLQQFKMLSRRTCFEIVPANLNYQGLIVVATGVFEYGGKAFVFQTFSCGCGPQPAIRGAYLEKEVPWRVSGLCAFFHASENQKERALADQQVMASVYVVRLPVGETEMGEVAAALRSRFGANKEISFF